MKRLTQTDWLHPLLLLLWIAIGAILRFTELASKPLWTDEFATIVFSLGHSFRTIPLDQVINAATLLQSAQVDPSTGVGDVVSHLMTESTHPPLYFILTHLWMRVFSPHPGLVSVWVARSLPALLGVVSIPAMFGLGWIAFRSRVVGQLAAALMAVSPFGVFLAQDARHYTLAVLWVIASVSCFAIALRSLQQRTALPVWLVLIWVGVNSLGMATHYFFALTLCAEGLVLVGFWILDFGFWSKKSGLNIQSLTWARIGAVAAGTIVGSLVWLPSWQNSYGSEITQWVYSVDQSSLSWINPILYTIATGLTMLTVFPIQQVPGAVQLGSVALSALIGLGASWLVIRGLRVQWQREHAWAIGGLIGMIMSAFALLLLVDYGLGADITRSFRYSFIYFPAMLLLLALGLAPYWFGSISHRLGKSAIALLLVMSLLGGLTVALNFAYQKSHRPDVVASRIQSLSPGSRLIVIAHHTHGQTGRLMAIAWQLQQTSLPAQYYLDHQSCHPQEKTCNLPTPQLRQTLAEQPQPFDLWLLNYRGATDLSSERCVLDSRQFRRGAPGTDRVDGYKYQLYHCGGKG